MTPGSRIQSLADRLWSLQDQLHYVFFGLDTFRILMSLVIVVVGFFLNRLLSRLINLQIDDVNRRQVYRKTVNYVTTASVLVGFVFVWVQNLTFLTAAVGFIAAGVAIALRDVIMSLFGWFKILWTHPFSVGDRIEIRDIQGDIIDISPLHTVLLELGNWIESTQSTGRIIYLPNHLIFQEPVFNSTMGFPYLWDEFSIVVTFESDLDEAEELMKKPLEETLDINYREIHTYMRKMGTKFAIRYENLRPKVYTKVEDSGVKLTLRYLARARGRRETRSRLSRRVMSLLEDHPAVELAYPTYRIYRRDLEQPDESHPPSRTD